MAISNRVGPPVTGDDFFGRVEELSRAHEYLDSNHSLVLSAPRRIGKSSFAKRLIADKKNSVGTAHISTLKVYVQKTNSYKFLSISLINRGFGPRR